MKEEKLNSQVFSERLSKLIEESGIKLSVLIVSSVNDQLAVVQNIPRIRPGIIRSAIILH